MPCGGGARPRCQPWGDTLPSLGPDPWAHQATLWAQAVVSPPPADKRVSSSPMKAVEGSDMMKAGRWPLPWEERSFRAASPSPPAPPSARCHRSHSPPCRSMPFQAQGREQPSLQSQGLVLLPPHGWFVAQGLSTSALFHVSAPVSSFPLRLQLLCAGGRQQSGSYRAHGARLPELGGCSLLCAERVCSALGLRPDHSTSMGQSPSWDPRS